MNPLDRPLTITRFADRFSARKSQHVMSLRDMLPGIRDTTAASKDKLPWLKLATFGDTRTDKGSLRHDANMTRIDGVEGDYDQNDITPAEVIGLLDLHELAGLVYTSPSHGPGKQRWRVLCPLSKPMLPDARRDLVARLNGALGGVLSRESFVDSQSYYYGRVGDNPDHGVWLVEGQYLDEATELESIASAPARVEIPRVVVPANTEPSEAGAAALAAACAAFSAPDAEGQRHQVLLAATVAVAPFILSGDLDQADTEAAIRDAMADSGREPNDGELESALEGALASATPYESPAADFAAVEVETRQPEDEDAWQANMLQRTQTGSIRPNIYNARLILRRHAPGLLALNLFADKVMLMARPPWERVGAWTARPMTDHDALLATVWLQQQGIQVGTTSAFDALVSVALETQYHPIRDYLGGLKWDGVSRIDNWLCTFLGAEDTPYTRAVAAKSLIAAVARIYQPGCKHDTVPLAEGTQGIGKSSALEALFGRPYFTDHIPDLTQKDAMLQLLGVWCIEFAEMDKLNRAEAARAKSFISTAVDRFRKPYGKVAESVPRQCVFWATMNPGAGGYITDETGARRYWPVRCGVGWAVGRRVDRAALVAARDQIWAEATARCQAGESWWLDNDALESAQQKQTESRFAEDTWADAIAEYVANRNDVSVAEILTDAIHKLRHQWTMNDQQRIGRTMVTMGWARKQVRVRGSDRREWRYVRGDSVTALPSRTSSLANLVSDNA